jgi:dTDP-4-dehydrorhamnose 3,5-epimerase
MIFQPTNIAGAYQIELERKPDSRGFFARAWCRDEFARHGLVTELAQAAAPHEEAKVVRCTRGAAYVVAVDIRPGSPSFGRWIGVELTADNRRLLYVPPGCAQGYQTLVDDSELFYQMSTAYAPGFGRGIRYDDPAFQIAWPLEVSCISEADQAWPPYRPTIATKPSLAQV